jgi:hypothetical protein
MDNDLLADKIVMYLYDKLPLSNVATDYEGRITSCGQTVRIHQRYPKPRVDMLIEHQIDIPYNGKESEGYDIQVIIEYFGELFMRKLLTIHSGTWGAFACTVHVYGTFITLIYGLIEEEGKAETMDIVQVWKAKGNNVRASANGGYYDKSIYNNFGNFVNRANEQERLSETWEVISEPVERQAVYIIPDNHGAVGATLHIYGGKVDVIEITSGASVTVKWKE